MKNFILFIYAFLFLTRILMSQSPVPGGVVHGTWTAVGSPYLIEGDITVPADSTLIIEPGVSVAFQNHYIFFVNGRVLAQGTETDSIFFYCEHSEGHRGIKMLNIPEVTDSSIFTYCRFQDANCTGTWPENCGGGIGIMDFSKVRIEHCLFIDNHARTGSQAAGGALAFGGFNGIVRNNSFINNTSFYGGAIICWQNSSPIISHNYFYDNYATIEGGAIIIWVLSHPQLLHNVYINNRANQFGGAISLYDRSNPEVRYNLFYNNLALQDGGAIEVNGTCNPKIINNTIVFNRANKHGGGVDIHDESCPLLINNIMWVNQSPDGSQVYNWNANCVPDFFNNDIQYGKDSIGGVIPQGQWKANIDEYPEFEDTTSSNFYLTEFSPCIDAGIDTLYDPDGTRSDMGAYYFHQTGIGIAEEVASEDHPELFCWPNPATEVVVIGLKLPPFVLAQGGNGVGLRNGLLWVFDITGKKVDELQVNRKTIVYNVSHLLPGMYLLRLQTGNRIATGRMVKR